MFDRAALPTPAVSRAQDAARLRRAMGRPPGWESLRLLEGIDVAALDESDRVDLLACWEAHEGWLLARRSAAVLAVAGAQPGEGPAPLGIGTPCAALADVELSEESVRGEVAAALCITPTTSGHRIATARFIHQHPQIAAALERGTVGYGHVAVLERELAAATAAVASEVIDRVLDDGPREAPSRLRQRTRRALARVDADAIRRRLEANRRRRSCSLSPEPDLQARITMTGPWEMAAWAFRQFDAWARDRRSRAMAGSEGPGTADESGWDPVRDGNADESLAALRADALVEAARLLALTLDRSDGDPGYEALRALPAADASAAPDLEADASGRRRTWSTAVVLCDLTTALGLTDEPGFVPGYGWVPAAVARELLASAESWRRFLTVDGALVETRGRRYRPSPRLRELVTARDQRCVFPGCGVPAAVADIDHTVPFDGGNTRVSNLAAMCRRHHRLKTFHPAWAVRWREGAPEWTAPSGHRYRVPPDPLWDPDEDAMLDGMRLRRLAEQGWQLIRAG